jgi:hypothetical protein
LRLFTGRGFDWSKTSALSVFALAHLADMMLRVELKAEPADEIELRFEEIDVVFLIPHQLLEQVACHIVLRGVAKCPGSGEQAVNVRVGLSLPV